MLCRGGAYKMARGTVPGTGSGPPELVGKKDLSSIVAGAVVGGVSGLSLATV